MFLFLLSTWRGKYKVPSVPAAVMTVNIQVNKQHLQIFCVIGDRWWTFDRSSRDSKIHLLNTHVPVAYVPPSQVWQEWTCCSPLVHCEMNIHNTCVHPLLHSDYSTFQFTSFTGLTKVLFTCSTLELELMNRFCFFISLTTFLQSFNFHLLSLSRSFTNDLSLECTDWNAYTCMNDHRKEWRCSCIIDHTW